MYRLLIITTLLFGSCSVQKQHITDTQVSYHRTKVSTEKSTGEIESIIAPYREKVNAEMDQMIGELPVDVFKKRPNSKMGNWFADMLHDIAQEFSDKPIAFAIQNYGGLRIPSLSKGPITKRNIYELMPFDNQLVILELTGQQTQALCDLIASDGGWPISKGLSLGIEDSKAINIKINGQAFSTQKTYLVALPDYVANGGGDADFLIGIEQVQSGKMIRDAVIDHLLELQSEGIAIDIDESKRIF